MPDKDEFEPMGRQWRSLFKMYIDPEKQKSSEEIAHAALKIVADMLNFCKGCLAWEDVVGQLGVYYRAGEQDKSRAGRDAALESLHRALDVVERKYADNRVSMVAIRAARVLARELAMQKEDIPTPAQLQHTFAKYVFRDVIAHCSLDRARAFSVVKRFRDVADACTFYNDVIQKINVYSHTLVERLVEDPSAAGLQYKIPRVAPSLVTNLRMF